MSEGTRRLKANRVIAGRTCDWCGEPLEFAQNAAVCLACETPHHAACWDERAGCSGGGCVNAPLKRLPPKVPPPPVPVTAAPPVPAGPPVPGAPTPAGVAAAAFRQERIRCIHCGHQMSARSEFCRRCKRVQTPDGIYRGPKENAPGAATSLTFGILALLVCGLIFGVFAITNAVSARKRMANDPRLCGEGMAKAGMILGIMGISWNALLLVAAILNSGRS